MTRYYLNIIFLLVITNLRGQQESSFNHYMFTSQLFNPAFVGLSEQYSVSTLNNLQWSGFEGNPSTNSLLFNGSSKSKLGYGAEIISDRIGPLDSNFLGINLSYDLAINNNANLSLGLKFSGNNSNINLVELEFENLADPNSQTKESYFTTNVGFGLYFYTEAFYLGFSVPYFFEPNQINKQRHFYFSGGYNFRFSEKLILNPNFLIKKTKNAPTSMNISAILFYDESFWIGTNFGTSNNLLNPKINGGDLSFMAGLKLTKSLTFGYSYSSLIGTWISTFNSNSHEVFIKYSFGNSPDEIAEDSQKNEEEEVPEVE